MVQKGDNVKPDIDDETHYKSSPGYPSVSIRKGQDDLHIVGTYTIGIYAQQGNPIYSLSYR